MAFGAFQLFPLHVRNTSRLISEVAAPQKPSCCVKIGENPAVSLVRGRNKTLRDLNVKSPKISHGS